MGMPVTHGSEMWPCMEASVFITAITTSGYWVHGIHTAWGYCLLIGSGYTCVAYAVHVVRMYEFVALCV